jgi:hypothetical protein
MRHASLFLHPTNFNTSLYYEVLAQGKSSGAKPVIRITSEQSAQFLVLIAHRTLSNINQSLSGQKPIMTNI